MRFGLPSYTNLEEVMNYEHIAMQMEEEEYRESLRTAAEKANELLSSGGTVVGVDDDEIIIEHPEPAFYKSDDLIISDDDDTSFDLDSCTRNLTTELNIQIKIEDWPLHLYIDDFMLQIRDYVFEVADKSKLEVAQVLCTIGSLEQMDITNDE